MASVEAAATSPLAPSSPLLTSCSGLIAKALHHLSPTHCSSIILFAPQLSHLRGSPFLNPTKSPHYSRNSPCPSFSHLRVPLPGMPLPHLSQANSYSPLEAQLGGHVIWDACSDFPVGAVALPLESYVTHTGPSQAHHKLHPASQGLRSRDHTSFVSRSPDEPGPGTVNGGEGMNPHLGSALWLHFGHEAHLLPLPL